ncbi:MAG: indolepyruvate ferredoxin oxidoreductase subunit alpha [Clostridiales bacterium]|nr:indolepyruvate ferredoxin oxidoreductase subunit alpha [Clostridiales bacterium]
MEKNTKLMLGNEAVARGLFEAGCGFVSSYPGTPSTEITEFAAKYDEIYAEWAPNEKVSAEAAHGAAVAGVRAFCGMKHVGLNVAADLFFTAAYTGVNAGFVAAVADDPGMHSSQNEQDSRHYARAAKLPMLEPADSAECKSYTVAAFELSEQFDTPVLLRLTTRIAHSQSVTPLDERKNIPKPEYVKDPAKYVMMPANARGRHDIVEDRLLNLKEYSETCSLNYTEYNTARIGIISSGIAYQYAREIFGKSVSYLKLGMVWPLPDKLLLEFASKVERVIVVEELDDIIESYCRSLGIKCEGKNLLPLTGEYSQEILAERLKGRKYEFKGVNEPVPPRPPVLCPGCPHRGIFYVLRKLKLFVSGDIGCYTLGALPPLLAMDTTLCMGASVSGLHGKVKAIPQEASSSIAVIGDSTFIHSGLTGLAGIAYNRSNANILILDNSITGMTGHQHNPTTGYTLKGEETRIIELESLCRALGIDSVSVVDPYDIAQCESVIKAELAKDCPSVIIARRPCVLLKSVKKENPYKTDPAHCKGCKACMAAGCPALSFGDKKAAIDSVLCTGCGICARLCKFGAITKKDQL